MEQRFEVSVIIPVYNGERFIERSVRSALAQAQTREVIIVDDGSTDGSLRKSRKLAENDDRIHVFTHPDGANRGVSASRNLGLEKATAPYNAFLDVDDYFLDGRFDETEQVFLRHPHALGVYAGHKIVEEEDQTGKDLTPRIRTRHEPESLFEIIATGVEHFLTCDLVIQRAMLPKNLRFREDLHFSEDTDFFLELALAGNLYPTSLRPVSVRTFHRTNTTNQEALARKATEPLFCKWVEKIPSNHWPKHVNRHFIMKMLEGRHGHIQPAPVRWAVKAGALAKLLIQKPQLLRKAFL